jgi:hypothetical protein
MQQRLHLIHIQLVADHTNEAEDGTTMMAAIPECDSLAGLMGPD